MSVSDVGHRPEVARRAQSFDPRCLRRLAGTAQVLQLREGERMTINWYTSHLDTACECPS